MKNYSFLGYFYSFINFKTFTINTSKNIKKSYFHNLLKYFYKKAKITFYIYNESLFICIS